MKKFAAATFFVCVMMLLIPMNTTASSNNERVTFAVSVSIASGSFSTNVITSDVNVKPGESVVLSLDAQKGPATLRVNLGSYGSPSITFDTPIGTLKVPVTSILVATVNVDVNGSLTGDLSVQGPGTLSSQSLEWSTWGSKSVTVNASPTAEEGDAIKVTLTLKYRVSLGASATVPFIGTQTIIPFQSLGELRGSSSVVATVHVGTGGDWIPGKLSLELAAIFAILLVLGLVFAAKKFSSPKVKSTARGITVESEVGEEPEIIEETPMQENKFCYLCGSEMPTDAGFCPKCGEMQLGD